jgi:hypothetical protein
MYKLVSEVGTRWSYLGGEQIYSNVVWMSNKEDASKYSLINNKGDKIDIDVDECLVDDETLKKTEE